MPIKYLATGRDIGPEICKAIGIDAGIVQEINIRIIADEMVIVSVELIPDTKLTDCIKGVVKRYQLVELSEVTPNV